MEREEENKLNEFKELVDAETQVDLERLRYLARHGVPEEIRGEVWKYLIGVATPDKSEEETRRNRMISEYKELKKLVLISGDLLKQIKGQIKELYGDTAVYISPDKRIKFENALVCFFNDMNTFSETSALSLEDIQTIIHLAAPLVPVLRAHDVYYCLHAVYQMTSSIRQDVDYWVGMLMMLFRWTLPELYAYFEQEEVEPNEWALPWFRHLLVPHLPMACVARLWDTYLSRGGMGLHPYVCLALLQTHHETLVELDSSEIKVFLHRLPAADMDGIIKLAYNIREEVRSKDLL
eukprot:gb/GECH01004460.1/.p1 GENE.gb/GECH01004460.1/~~gb/GECH01004460.1/.p1  ORF type:complete len:293 (+),score=46.88 gb/GECH01004460.1/:1-879(+)